MMSKTIATRLEAALADPQFGQEQVRWLDDSMRVTMESCANKASTALFLFGIFTLAWVLVKAAAVGEISVLGVRVDNAKIVSVVLPVLAAFCLYQFHCFEAMASTIDTARATVFKVKYKNLFDNDIEQVLTYSSVLAVDNALSNLEPAGSWLRRTSDAWLLIAALVMLVLPGMAILWMVYSTLAERPLALAWCVVSAALSLVLFVRSVLVVVLHLKRL